MHLIASEERTGRPRQTQSSRSALRMLTSDTAIETDAANRLRQSPYAEIRGVACEVREGVLILRGRVTSFFHKQVALATVRQLGSVEQVRNDLEVIQGTEANRA